MPGFDILDSMWRNPHATGTYATTGETQSSLSSASYISKDDFEIDDQDRAFFNVPDAHSTPNQEPPKRMKPVGLYFVDQPIDEDQTEDDYDDLDNEDYNEKVNFNENGRDSKVIKGIVHNKKLLLIDGVEVAYWFSDTGVKGPPVVNAILPVINLKHKLLLSPQLQMTNRIGDLVEAQREMYKVTPGRVIESAMDQFSSSSKSQSMSALNRMKVKRALADIANSQMYLSAKEVDERSDYVEAWLSL